MDQNNSENGHILHSENNQKIKKIPTALAILHKKPNPNVVNLTKRAK